MGWRGEVDDRGFREGWIEDERDVFKGWVRDKITVWENIHLCGMSPCTCVTNTQLTFVVSRLMKTWWSS